MNLTKKVLSVGIASIMAMSTMAAGTQAFASQLNSVQTAESIALNETKTTLFRYGETNDSYLYENTKYFSFTAPTSGYYEFTLTGYQPRVDNQDTSASIVVTDSTGKNVDTGGYYNKYYQDVKAIAELEAGKIYYIEIYYSPSQTAQYVNSGYAESSINLSVTPHTHDFEKDVYTYTTFYNCKRCDFSYQEKTQSTIASVKLEKTKYVYDGKEKTPNLIAYDTTGNRVGYTSLNYPSSRTKVGNYTVNAFVGQNSYALNFQIVPKGTSINSIKSGKKSVSLKWKKQQKQTTGYQIQLSTSSKFKSPKNVYVASKTTSKTIKGLKAKKKYYARMRTYKTVNGKKIYSSWSKTKTVKTK